jgi:hypothetical protein
MLDLLTAVDVQGPGLPSHGAGAPAVGAGLLRAEGLGLLLQGGGESAFGQAGGGGGGELLQGGEIEVEAGAGVPKGPASDNLAPLGGESTDILEVLGREGLACHRPSWLGVRETGRVLLSFVL